ncbi:N(4)-(beta-N-acetylglucosaminyl)-L-asparaginase [bacterium]|nr:N(4)-(beta-N-acetylglucosaminyl)-L-asparaginase [bacterium]
MSDENSWNRRRFLKSLAAIAAATPFAAPIAKSFAKPTFKISGKTVVVSSANGVKTTELAYESIIRGEDVLDAVIKGVNLVENDPEDMTVGLGGLPNEHGVVELDSAVMHGPTHRAGAVAALQGIRNPSKVAKAVLESTDHVLIVGKGALDFAKMMGFKVENLLTEKARKRWLQWKQGLSHEDDWLDSTDLEGMVPHEKRTDRPTGTIHCAGLDVNGNISCVTTTSGLAYKIPGRVGDSPIIGAGLYVDNEIGSCGSTGRGEANLQNLCSFSAVELMRNGMSPVDAGLEVLRRVARHTTEPYLLQPDGKPNFGLKFYLIARDGRYAGVSMFGPSKFAVCDDKGARLEDCAVLFE